MEKVFLVVPGNLRYYEVSRALLNSVCETIENEKQISNISNHVLSAFNEAFTNIVLHSYDDDLKGHVEIEIGFDDKSIRLIIIDYGKGFNPDKIIPPDLDLLPEGGLGWFIIKSFMNRVSYKRGDKNVLIMEKDFEK